MNGHGIGTHSFCKLANARNSVAASLNRTDIADDECIRGHVAHVVGGSKCGLLGHRSLRAKSKANSQFLCHFGEVAVDGGSLAGTAGHARDEDWGLKSFS